MAIDVAMTLLLLFLMGYQLWGEAAHEWAGSAIFILFMLHHWMNRGWYKGLFRGKYHAMRICMLTLNLLLLAAMFTLMFSAVVLSRYVFSFLSIDRMSWFARKMHMAGAYWSFVLMALHLGLHWNLILNHWIRRAQSREKSVKQEKMTEKRMFRTGGKRRSAWILATLVALYGLYAFIRRNILSYLLLRVEFAFLDYNESKLFFYLDYVAMMGLFIYLGHYGSRMFAGVKRLLFTDKRGK